MDAIRRTTTCCIVGGGPAGMMLGLVLARAGIDVVLLEKHEDFFRDFRGDTIHPSTLDLIDQLGLRYQFDAIPHSSFSSLDIVVNGTRVRPVDFRHLRGRNRTVDLMPQWDFLDLLADAARALPNFHLVMSTEVTGLLRDAGAVTGVRATTADGPLEVSATLTIAADGRHSVVRDAAGLTVKDYGVAIDVLWFRLPMPATVPPSTLGYLSGESMLVTIPRVNYYQTAMLIPKGAFDTVRAAGLPAFRALISRAASFLEPVVPSLDDWSSVKLLSVQVNRLRRWHLPGLLCIGDAAHAMSPAFGVGINYAIQDAVATANHLAGPLSDGSLRERHLAAVQRRRIWPVRLMQPIQLMLHRFIAKPGGAASIPTPLPRSTRIILMIVLPVLRRVSARVIGRGFLPEKIAPGMLRSPEDTA